MPIDGMRSALHIPLHTWGPLRYIGIMNSQMDPLTGSLPAEVPLPNAPLMRVIAQVRFPPILSIEKRDFVAPFQEAIRARYPILRAEQTRGVLLGTQGSVPMSPAVTWRFTGLDEKWRVSLATDFAAIETTAYDSRSDLLARLEEVILALGTFVAPRTVDRLGVRFIDRITGAAVSEIERFVRSEILGIAGTAIARHTSHALSDALFSLPNQPAQMRARWGLLPPNTTVDPSAIEPIEEPSWILDLDTFSSGPHPFESAAILSDARDYAERAYGFFRWVVTDEFLRFFGGKV